MSRSTTSPSNPAIDRNTRRLRCHRTPPPRRSPRLLSQKNDDWFIQKPPSSKKNQKSPSEKKTHFRSPQVSPFPHESTSTEKTHQGCSIKCLNEPWRPTTTHRADASLQTQRQSPRLASNQAEVMKGQKLRQPIKSMDGVRGNTEIMGRKRVNPMISTTIEGVENKRKKLEDNVTRREKKKHHAKFRGWTEEQEVALRRAYLVAKPSPHFWKRVSKMVPGKSAQECFDRIQANFVTPPQRQTRLSNKTNTPPLGYFTAVGFMEPKGDGQRNSKYKPLVARKTARHLLRKQHLTDQNQQADLFSVFETSPIALALDFPEINLPPTPKHLLNSPGFLQRCNGESSLAHKKMLSRLRIPSQADHTSPEVLKQIKNMALHEKYIDELHCREARRTSTKTANSLNAKDNKIKVALKAGGVKAARSALISKAKDFISQFQCLQANSMQNHEVFCTDEEDADYDDNDVNDEIDISNDMS